MCASPRCAKICQSVHGEVGEKCCANAIQVSKLHKGAAPHRTVNPARDLNVLTSCRATAAHRIGSPKTNTFDLANVAKTKQALDPPTRPRVANQNDPSIPVVHSVSGIGTCPN